MVLKDWKSTWKEGLKRGTIRIWLWLIWFAACLTLNKWNEGFAIYGQFLFSIALYYLHSMFPNRLSKAMFLLPIEREEKERYLRTNYMLKVVILEIFHIIVTLGCVINGEIAIESGILILIMGVIWNLDLGIEIVGRERAYISHVVLQIMAVLFIDCSVEDWNRARDRVWSLPFVIVVAVFLLVQLLLLVRIYRKEYQYNLNLSCDYEEDYVIRQNEGKKWWQYENHH